MLLNFSPALAIGSPFNGLLLLLTYCYHSALKRKKERKGPSLFFGIIRCFRIILYIPCCSPQLFLQWCLDSLGLKCWSLSPIWLSATPWLWPTRFFCPWNSPAKNIGVSCHRYRDLSSGFFHCCHVPLILGPLTGQNQEKHMRLQICVSIHMYNLYATFWIYTKLKMNLYCYFHYQIHYNNFRSSSL